MNRGWSGHGKATGKYWDNCIRATIKKIKKGRKERKRKEKERKQH